MTTVFEFKEEAQEYTFYPGYYKIELWGGQGGNVTGYREGGKGAYAFGRLRILKTQKMYIFTGGKGCELKSSGTCESSFNGGSRGSNYGSNAFGAGGAGSTDLRTNLNFYSRILVAAGGSGAAIYGTTMNDGACGGDLNGRDGRDGANSVDIKGNGGSQESGGAAVNQHGAFFYGGNQTNSGLYGSGGGSGWFGGGSATGGGATGGSGSSYAHIMFMTSKLISGCDAMHNFYGNGDTVGHVGNGAAKITFLSSDKVVVNPFGYHFPLSLFTISLGDPNSV